MHRKQCGRSFSSVKLICDVQYKHYQNVVYARAYVAVHKGRPHLGGRRCQRFRTVHTSGHTPCFGKSADEGGGGQKHEKRYLWTASYSNLIFVCTGTYNRRTLVRCQ